MADGVIQVPVDSTGKKIRTIETTVAGNTVEQQVVTLADSAGVVDNAGVKIADGADIAQGATTDAAITSDSTGSNSGKLRGLVKILASVWDSGNGRLKVDGSAVVQPVSFPTNSALPVTGQYDVFNLLLLEMRKCSRLLEILTNETVADGDVEVP